MAMPIAFIRAHADLEKYLQSGKVLIIYGPRRVGKTTLLNRFLDGTSYKYRLDSGDNIRIQQILSSQDFQAILDYAEGYELLAIDEAQNVPDIGRGLKILVDQRPDLRIIATGSSSFILRQATGEPLTGRKKTLTLFPLAQLELAKTWNRHELIERLPDFLIFGSYPDVLLSSSKAQKIEVLRELVESYILRDILAHETVKGPQALLKLLKLLAFQIGQLVSINELASQLMMDSKTVARYLDLLEKSFIIFELAGLSRNPRNEISKKKKYYFYDNGIRNGIISQFNNLDLRDDVGGLWENFCVMERVKKNSYEGFYGNLYFWRTYGGQEVDLVEEIEGKLNGFEFKWAKKVPAPEDWAKYSNATYECIRADNYLGFVGV